MSAKRIYMLSLCLLFCASCLNAQEDQAQKAKDILKIGRKNQKRMSYKSTSVNNTVQAKKVVVGYNTTIYNKANPDGTNYYRFEGITVNAPFFSPPYIVIENNEGRFELRGDLAIKCNYQCGQSEAEMADQDAHATYSFAEGAHLGIPCYIVTQRIQPTEERYNSFIKSYLSDSNTRDFMNKKTPAQQKEFFEERFIALQTYCIGKTDGFIYESAYYNVRGRKIGSFDRGVVELNASLDDKLFQIPDNFTIKPVNNSNEYAAIVTEETRKMIENNKKKTVSP